jgi:PAS domain S-box-containing protein
MDLGRVNTDVFSSGIPLKHSLKTKLVLLIAGFIALTALSLGYFYGQSSDRIILQHYSKQKLLQERLQSQELFQGISSARRDLLVLRNSPVLHTLVRELDKAPSSAASSAWKQRLTDTFISFIKSSPDYMQMRLVGVKNGGHELVRVDRTGKKVIVTAGHNLQNKSHRDYYRAITQLGPGDVYTSNINLNREFGKISTPRTPTIRVATPLYYGRKQMFAFLIINVDLTRAFAAISKLVEPGSSLYIVNKKGDYLLNPDKSKEFAFDFGHVERLQKDYPALAQDLANMGPGGMEREITFNGKQQFLHAFLLTKQHNIGTDGMTAIELIPKKKLFHEMQRTEDTGHIFALILTLTSIFIAWLFSHSILSPIRFLTKAAVSASRGSYTIDDFPEGRDEVGLLSRSFREMIHRIENRESIIRDNQSRYKAIFSGADASIVIIDHRGNIEEANDAFCQMLGFSHKEVKKHKLTSLIEDQNSNIDFIDSQCQQCNLKQFCIGEVKLLADDGSLIPVTASINGFNTASGRRSAIYMYDQRPQRQAEEERMNLLLQLKQAHKMESIGLLASGIAHDFNNVLSCVSGYSELMKLTDTTNNSEHHQYLDEILDAADKAREMIRNLMLYSRSDNVVFHTENAQKAIQDIIAVLEHALTSRIILSHNIDIDTAAMEVAPFQLQQIILNLCINARDAMGGSGAIHIDAHADEAVSVCCSSCGEEFRGEFITLTVSDEGPGIEPEQVSKLFEPFYTTKEADKGTGLGLYMVHTIVHETGGHVVVESRPGEYCSFTLYLPYSSGLSDSDNHELSRLGDSIA